MSSILLLAAALVIHEAGHAVMALCLDVKCYRISWHIWGLGLARDLHPSRLLEGLITVAGPVASLAFFLQACMEGWYVFALANACVLVFGSIHDFARLFMYAKLKRRAVINRRLVEVCQ